MLGSKRKPIKNNLFLFCLFFLFVSYITHFRESYRMIYQTLHSYEYSSTIKKQVSALFCLTNKLLFDFGKYNYKFFSILSRGKKKMCLFCSYWTASPLRASSQARHSGNLMGNANQLYSPQKYRNIALV